VQSCVASAPPPDIDVSPLLLAATQAPDTTSSQVLTVANGGGSDLNWSIDEESGSGGTCSAPADVPWLSVSPTSGVTGVGNSDAVTVTFDSTGLAAGTYDANLCVRSDDPDAGPGNGTELVVVPVSLTVEQTTFTLYLPAVFKP